MINSFMRLFEFEQPSMLKNLLELCRQELELDQLPKINLLDNQPTIDHGTSFGEFTDGGIDVVTAGRHPMDVMRTVAHELVHYKQRVEGLELNGEDGSDTENQANAIAGIIMRRFGKMYPHYFEDTI